MKQSAENCQFRLTQKKTVSNSILFRAAKDNNENVSTEVKRADKNYNSNEDFRDKNKNNVVIRKELIYRVLHTVRRTNCRLISNT